MIQFAVFQITEADKAEEQEALNVFLRSHRVLTVETAAFPAVSGWGYNVKYMDGAPQAVGSRIPRDRVDYMEVLTPDQFRRFYAYRNRRKKISEDDGIAAFEVLTDSQMAELAQGDTLAWRRRFWGDRRKESGSNRVKRGGSWNNDASNCTSSNRNNNDPSNNNNNNGFRLCCSAAPHREENAVPACSPFVGRGRKSKASGLDKNQGCPALVGVPKPPDGRITFKNRDSPKSSDLMKSRTDQ